jgi:hypothetical protein
MTMKTLRIPSCKRRPKFAADVPSHVQRLVWIKWFHQQAVSERPFFPISSAACGELAVLLGESGVQSELDHA